MQSTNYLTLHSSRLAALQTNTLQLSTLTGSTIRASFLTLSSLTVSSINGLLPGTGSGAGSFSTSGVAGAVYYSAGNVGIGSAAPGFRLVVDNGSSTGINTVIQASGITSGTNTSLLLGKALSNNNCGTILWNHVADGSATNYMGFGYHGADNRLNITCSGTVGIGTTTTAANQLMIHGGNAISGISLGDFNTTGSGIKYIGITATTNGASVSANSGFSGITFGGPNDGVGGTSGYVAFHTHSFGVASNERMRIDKSGNVGIGTNAPGHLLDVNGTLNVRGSFTVNGTAVATGTGSVWTVSAGNLITYSAGNTSLSRNRLIFSNGANDFNHSIYNNYNNSDAEGIWDGMKFNVYAGAWFRVGQSNPPTVPTTALFIDASGYVGIGTTTLSSPLTVYTAISGAAYYRSRSASNIGCYSEWRDYNATGRFIVGCDGAGLANIELGAGIIGTWSANSLAFLTNAVERMRITSTGNVGIGTNTSTSYLTVYSKAARTHHLIISGQEFYQSSNISTGIALNIGVNRTTNKQLWIMDPDSAINTTAQLIRMTPSSGSIDSVSTDGTTMRPLYIGGSSVSINTLGTGTVYSSSGILTNTNPSDPSLKTNIVSLPDVDIAQLNPVQFNWIDTEANGAALQFGFLANDIQTLFPNLVSNWMDKDGNEKLGYDTVSLIPVLTKSLQQQNTKISILESQLAALHRMCDMLQARLDAAGI